MQMEDTLWAGLTDQQINMPMGITAENLAEQYGITRQQCDEFAVRSNKRWKLGKTFALHKNAQHCSTCHHVLSSS